MPRKKSSTRKTTAKRKKAVGRPRKTSATRRKTTTRKTTSRKKAASRKKSSRKYGTTARKKVKKTMDEMKRGQLKSGRAGKRVTSRKQAIAIALSEARRSGGKVPRRKKGS